MFGQACFNKLVKDYTYETVLDIGCGKGEASKAFLEVGKNVVGVDPVDPEITNEKFRWVPCTIQNFERGHKFDLVWASHVLEHQRNVGHFLDIVVENTKDGGIIAITIPPAKDQIVGGHLSIWNPGLLVYNMILAGLDCSEASVAKYGYNISVIVKKDLITVPRLLNDMGDIERLSDYFPYPHNYHGFDGSALVNHNWG